MLFLFRRHMVGCKFTSRKNRNCQCPIAVEGTLDARKIRKSLDLRSWEAAQKLVRDWESNPNATLSRFQLEVITQLIEGKTYVKRP